MRRTESLYLVDRSHAKGVRHIPPEQVTAYFEQLGTRLAVSSGQFEIVNRCHVRDLDWNHMDQHHRPFIHDTYHEAVRIAATKDVAVSVTKIRLAGIPVFIQVTDVRLRSGLFYQSFTVLGLFFIHIIIRAIPVEPTPSDACKSKQTVEWFIVSNRFLRPFHGFLNARLERLNRQQNNEDLEIRDRRAELRSRGYGFSSDEPDFLSSNSLTLNTRVPPLDGGHHRVAIPSAIGLNREKLRVGPVELLVRRDAIDAITVWPAVCPHEGADLSKANECVGRDVTCHWHGLRFTGAVLTNSNPTGMVGLLGLRLDGEDLVVWQAVDPSRFRPAALSGDTPASVSAPPITPQ